jgi:hypothetical protein
MVSRPFFRDSEPVWSQKICDSDQADGQTCKVKGTAVGLDVIVCCGDNESCEDGRHVVSAKENQDNLRKKLTDAS